MIGTTVTGYAVRARIPLTDLHEWQVPSTWLPFHGGFARGEKSSDGQWYLIVWVDAWGRLKSVTSPARAFAMGTMLGRRVMDALLRQNARYELGLVHGDCPLRRAGVG